MKTLKQYIKQLDQDRINDCIDEELLNFVEEQINENKIDEGLFSTLKKTIKGGVSLLSKMYKKSKDLGVFIKKKIQDNNIAKLLKNFDKGRAFWDEWFKGSEFEKYWKKINPLPDAVKESLYDRINEEETPKAEGEEKKDKKEENSNEDSSLFSEEKYKLYAQHKGMISRIFGGFAMIYDYAQANKDQKVFPVVSKYIKDALKSSIIDQEDKDYLKEAIKATGQEDAIQSETPQDIKPKEGETNGEGTPKESPKTQKTYLEIKPKIDQKIGIKSQAVDTILKSMYLEEYEDLEEDLMFEGKNKKNWPSYMSPKGDDKSKIAFKFRQNHLAIHKNDKNEEQKKKNITAFTIFLDGIAGLYQTIEAKNKSEISQFIQSLIGNNDFIKAFES